MGETRSDTRAREVLQRMSTPSSKNKFGYRVFRHHPAIGVATFFLFLPLDPAANSLLILSPTAPGQAGIAGTEPEKGEVNQSVVDRYLPNES